MNWMPGLGKSGMLRMARSMSAAARWLFMVVRLASLNRYVESSAFAVKVVEGTMEAREKKGRYVLPYVASLTKDSGARSAAHFQAWTTMRSERAKLQKPKPRLRLK